MTELDDPAPQPRKLAIDLSDLVNAIENNTWEMAYFLDLETGEVISGHRIVIGQLDLFRPTGPLFAD